MVRLVWSRNAISDLKSIRLYISFDSVLYAKKLIKEILYQVQKLSLAPNLGRMIPELQNKNYKELIYKNYRIMFKIISHSEILILAIYHGNRNFDLDKIEPK
jgi:plasmid stabilization system protein ParE